MSGKLGGEGNDSLEFAFSNEVGLTDIGIRTEMGAIFVNQKIEPTEPGTLNILNLVSTNALPSILNQKNLNLRLINLPLTRSKLQIQIYSNFLSRMVQIG